MSPYPLPIPIRGQEVQVGRLRRSTVLLQRDMAVNEAYKNLGGQIVEAKKQGATCPRSGSVLDEVSTPAHVHPVPPDFRRAEDEDACETALRLQGCRAEFCIASDERNFRS